MASGISEPLRRLHRKLTLAIWLGRVARQGAVVLALAGGAILLARAAFDVPADRALWLLLPLAAVPFTAWMGVRERVPSEQGAVAWLDLRSGAAGHLLTDFEVGDERWTQPLARQLDRLPELPPIRIGNLARPLVPALAFAVLAVFVPLSRAEPSESTSFFDAAIETLSDQLQTLDAASQLEEPVANELKRRVEDLAKNVDPSKPEAMLEAIDSLRADLGKEGQDAAEKAKELIERFGHVESLAGKHSGLAQELMQSGLRQMLKSQLPEGMFEELEAIAPELAQQIFEGGMKLPPGFELPKDLDPETLAALSKLLRDQLRENMGDLSLAGLADLAKLKAAGELTNLQDLIDQFHKHTEECKKPGGT